MSELDGVLSWTAAEVVAAMRSRQLSCREYAQVCLDRIFEVEPAVEAFEYLDPELVLERAAKLDKVGPMGPLHGVGIGVKDIIDTHDMPTALGSEIYRGRQPVRDAACVALARRAGAVVVGKTVTTEFANVTPGKTRNPFDRDRTPGGSSSGSAAAVAAGMTHVAIGTQTTGSTIRPASFCGVVGYRPTFGHLSTSGVLEVSGSVDTLGLLGRSVEDVALCRDVLMGVETQVIPDEHAPRIGFCRTPYWGRLDQVTRTGLDGLANQLADAGGRIEETDLPVDLESLEDPHRWITAFEMARNLSWEVDNHWDRLSEGIREGRINDGLACDEGHYTDMQDRARRARAEVTSLFHRFDALLAPAALGEAPPGENPVPHPWLYQGWTLLRLPVLTLPILAGPNGLPVGAQLIGSRDSDRRLLAVAQWVERSFDAGVSTIVEMA